MTLRYALPLIGGLAALSAHAQPTLDTDNIPAQGQEFPVRTVEAYSSTGPIGATQSFHFWNMLVPATGTRNYRYFNASITPTAASFPTATFLSTDGGADTLFWTLTTDGLVQVGEKIGGIGIINFSDPLLELKLPCTLGTTWSDPTGANYTASGTPITRVGTITGIGDAYGTLVLPAGASYSDVLRVHVRRNITNNTILGPVVQIANVYYYYSEALAFPRLKLQQDSVQVNGGAWGVTRKAEWIGENFAVGMDDLTDADVFTAYPNPTADLLNIVRTNSGNAWVEVLDAAGRLVASEPMTTDRLSIPTDALASGVYQVRLRNVQAVLGVQRVVVR